MAEDKPESLELP